VEIAGLGQLQIDLGDGRDDPTVIEDARTLLLGAIDGIVVLEDDPGHTIVLEFVTKGELGEMAPEQHVGPVRIEDLDVGGWVAFNPVSRNEFRIDFEGGLLDAVGLHDAAHRLDLGSPVELSDEDHDLRAAVGTPGTPPIAAGVPVAYSWTTTACRRSPRCTSSATARRRPTTTTAPGAGRIGRSPRCA